MNFKAAVVMIAIAVLGSPGLHAADTKRPDQKAVVRAFFAATNAGNVDASLAFFADDGYHILPGGKKFAGKDELRKLLDLFTRENVRFDMPPDAVVKDDAVIFRMSVSTRWLVELGISPTSVVHVVTVDDDKIKTWYAYYPQRSIARIKQACDVKPDVLAPNRPCGEAVLSMQAYLDELVAKGLARDE